MGHGIRFGVRWSEPLGSSSKVWCSRWRGELHCEAPSRGGREGLYWQSGGISRTPYRVPLYVYELRGLLGVTIARKTNKSAGMCPTSVLGQNDPPSAQHCQSLRSAAR